MSEFKIENDGVLTIFLESDRRTDRVIRFCEVATQHLVIRIRPSRTMGLFDVFNAEFARTVLKALRQREPESYALHDNGFSFSSDQVGIGALTILFNSCKHSDHEIVTVEITHGSAAQLFIAALLTGHDGDVLEFRERTSANEPFVDHPVITSREGMFRAVQCYLNKPDPLTPPLDPSIDTMLRDYKHLIARSDRFLH